ncbi:hypothetical protein BJY04DRAFT_218345 [Aspergillus karnatakaensis]|uniref:Zn(II)2Cys6 transcription factor domain-containing protein n=1 Tax=Aspergillus karnatakaensis TaxID=1810916 RepID=UPI003CCE17FA
MVRRAHKKSRGGCIECKRRHVKCDEKRPICSNCISSQRLCEYAGFRIIQSRPGASIKQRARSSDSLSPSSSTPPDTSPLMQPDPPANMLHTELFHHLSTQTLPLLCANGSNLALQPTELINFALATPYLFNELLALAALHLGIRREAQKDYYRHHAAQLQNHALRLLNESEPHLNQGGESETSISVLLFSSILGIHLLCDTLVFRSHDLQDFLDRFIHYLRIHRGVRTVVGGNWKQLKKSSFSSVLTQCEPTVTEDIGPDQECTRLLSLIDGAKLGASFTNTYIETIKSLEWSIQVAQNGSGGDQWYGALLWPIMVPWEYIDMLVHRRPEALVILAHFAVLLHSCRNLWVFGDGGRFIIESVSQYLGPEWAGWMEWPSHSLVDSSSQIPYTHAEPSLDT